MLGLNSVLITPVIAYVTTRNPYIVLFGFVTVAEFISNKGLNVLYQGANPTDFNDCSNTGVYICGGLPASNAPISNPYGTLAVFKSNSDGGYTIQLFFSRHSNSHLYSRTLSGNWTQIL